MLVFGQRPPRRPSMVQQSLELLDLLSKIYVTRLVRIEWVRCKSSRTSVRAIIKTGLETPRTSLPGVWTNDLEFEDSFGS
jgi:hypothetical protein